MITNIFVPLDYSSTALPAISHAIIIARYSGAKIHVSFVQAAHVLPVAHRSAGDDLLITRQEEYFDGVERQLCRAGVQYETSVQYGNPLNQLMDHAARVVADMIVLGARNPFMQDESILNCFARNMLRLGSCPVMLVQAQPYSSDYCRIAVPIEQTIVSGNTIAQLSFMGELAAAGNAELVLLQALPLDAERSYDHGPILPLFDFSVYDSEAAQQATASMRQLAEPLLEHGIRVEILCGAGAPDEVLAAYARLEHPDLIALVAHPGTAFSSQSDGISYGSLFEQIETPIVLLPEPGRVARSETDEAALSRAGNFTQLNSAYVVRIE